MTLLEYWPDAKYCHGAFYCAYCGEEMQLTDEVDLVQGGGLLHKECADERAS